MGDSPRTSSPPARRQADDTAPTEAPPPATLFKQKVKWSLDFIGVEKDDNFVRACVFEDLDTSYVRGDDGGDGVLGELDETERETTGRVEAEAFQDGLRDDIISVDDVFRQEVDKATDSFVQASIPVAESLEEDGLLRREGDLDARRAKGRKQPEVIDLEKVAVEGMTNAQSQADVDENLTVGVKQRATGETVRFGQLFSSIEQADAFCRSYHSPLCQLPGMAKNCLLMLCCAPSSAMPRRKLSSESKGKKSATRGEGGECDEGCEGGGDEVDSLEATSKSVKRPQGSRASTFFTTEGCHGMVQVSALALSPCSTPLPSRLAARPCPHGLTPHPHHDPASGAVHQSVIFARRR